MCYNRGVAILGATRAGLYLFLVPVFGALFAMIILGEQLHLYHASGFILIIAGVLLGTGSRDSETAITQSGSVAGEEDAPR
jgi:drug/metabolite transporter (DMT)-like permease